MKSIIKLSTYLKHGKDLNVIYEKIKCVNNVSGLYRFTLVEVLIALGVIGVVAALTIPVFSENMNQYSLTKAQYEFEIKMTEALHQMMINNALSGYATNDAFADEFAKYIKIQKRCASSNLTQCFVSKFTNGNDKEISTSTLTAGTSIGQSTNSTSTVGLVFLDGTTALIAFKPDCDWVNPYNQGKKADIEISSCLALVYDINGLKKPNKIGKDIKLINASISDCDGVQIGSFCVGGGDVSYDFFGTFYNEMYEYTANNYWAGADKACSDLGMRLPNLSELNSLYTYNSSHANALNMSDIYWSSDEANAMQTSCMNFQDGSEYTVWKEVGSIKVRCIK